MKNHPFRDGFSVVAVRSEEICWEHISGGIEKLLSWIMSLRNNPAKRCTEAVSFDSSHPHIADAIEKMVSESILSE
jgi:hypothetical protein